MVNADDMTPVTDFRSHVTSMDGFHPRYMGGNKVMRPWTPTVRSLKPPMIVSQHGKPFAAESIEDLLIWAGQLQCGMDLIGEEQMLIP